MRIPLLVMTFLLLLPIQANAGGTCSGVKGGCGRSAYRSSARTSAPSGGAVHVSGYTRKDGTYVRPHTRSAPGTADHSHEEEKPLVRYRSTARTTARTSAWTGDVTDTVATMAPVVRPPARIHTIPEIPAPQVPRSVPDPIADSLLRTWTDRSGSFSVRARFGGMLGTTVTLKKLDGTSVKLDVSQLSEVDQAWIEARKNH